MKLNSVAGVQMWRMAVKWTVVVAFLAANDAWASREPVKAAVFRSQGTIFLGMTIWNDLNTRWSEFGDVPLEIDWWSLAGSNITGTQLNATGADVIILSSPGYLTYTQDEIWALRSYVERGHGLIITYGTFESADRALATLVGLSATTQAGTNTWLEPFSFEVFSADHPMFERIEMPYMTGVLQLASPVPYGTEWQLVPGAALLASARPEYQGWVGNGVIVGNETADYRGLYFSHYPENLADGANSQDMRLFYNGLLWTAAPEPSSSAMLIGASLLAMRRGRRRRKALSHRQSV